MNGKSQMEILYDNYLKADDRKVIIGDTCFYKIISKDRLSIRGGTVMIVVPRELFQHVRINCVSDEYGRTYKLGGVAHHCFRCPIPQWYLETVSVPVEGIHEIDEIGNYLAEVEENE